METAKPKIHPAWRILIACCLINMSALGMTNCNGLFYPEITSELGFDLSKLMIHCIFQGVTSAIVLFKVDWFYRKFPLKAVLAVSFLLYHLPFMAMSMFTEIWHWCAAAIVAGIGSAFLLYIPVPMLVNNWFIKKKKLALSICFVASGFSGILTSLLMGQMIDRFGWRASYVIRGAVLLLVALPAVIMVIKSPAELGLTAYGADEEAKEDQKVMGERGMALPRTEKKKRFLWAVVLAVMCNLSCGMTSMLPHYAHTLGYTVVFGSYLTSLAMVGNITSKASLGPAAEKFGIRKSVIFVTALMAGGFLLLASGAQSIPAIYAASITTGISACINTLTIPNLLDTFASGDDYVYMLSRCSTGTMLASAFSVSISSALYDSFGQYRPVFFIYGLLGCAIIAILVFVFKSYVRKERVK